MGSGEGASELQANAVDFAVTDSPMDGAKIELAERHGSPVHVPLVLGAVTVSYNLVGVEAGVKLDGETIADIFLGKIRSWNDPAITKLNPGIELPPTKVRVLHRSDASGATALFTQFLSEHSRQWRREVGSGMTVKWPIGMSVGSGGERIVYKARRFRGTITYIELPYALKAQPIGAQPCCASGGRGLGKTAVAAVQNASGNFVIPDPKSAEAAVEHVEVPADLRLGAIHPSSPDAYPIPSVDYALVYRDMCKAGKSRTAATGVSDFLDFALGDGQKTAERLDYAPLPPDLLDKSQAEVESLTCDGRPLELSSDF